MTKVRKVGDSDNKVGNKDKTRDDKAVKTRYKREKKTRKERHEREKIAFYLVNQRFSSLHTPPSPEHKTAIKRTEKQRKQSRNKTEKTKQNRKKHRIK